MDGCSGETSYLTALTDITLGKRIISICVRLISGTLALKSKKKVKNRYWSMTLKLKYIMVKSTVTISRDIGSYIGKNWIHSQLKRAKPNLHDGQSNWMPHVSYFCCPEMVWISYPNQIARKRESINRKSYRRNYTRFRIVSCSRLSDSTVILY